MLADNSRHPTHGQTPPFAGNPFTIIIIIITILILVITRTGALFASEWSDDKTKIRPQVKSRPLQCGWGVCVVLRRVSDIIIGKLYGLPCWSAVQEVSHEMIVIGRNGTDILKLSDWLVEGLSFVSLKEQLSSKLS